MAAHPNRPQVVRLRPEPTPATTEQRVRIRHLLETNFGEGIGCYHVDWDDAKTLADQRETLEADLRDARRS